MESCPRTWFLTTGVPCFLGCKCADEVQDIICARSGCSAPLSGPFFVQMDPVEEIMSEQVSSIWWSVIRETVDDVFYEFL
ncbi:hypothetical protein BDM02DRAFT_3122055, partial [Thelephora ganbajun]